MFSSWTSTSTVLKCSSSDLSTIYETICELDQRNPGTVGDIQERLKAWTNWARVQGLGHNGGHVSLSTQS
ncbi:hypothetical protein TNCV_3643871 [Trichonephila clavipes]|nr:hypothetical protein TNCV_3643871 [Trichonephila clavipes]